MQIARLCSFAEIKDTDVKRHILLLIVATLLLIRRCVSAAHCLWAGFVSINKHVDEHQQPGKLAHFTHYPAVAASRADRRA